MRRDVPLLIALALAILGAGPAVAVEPGRLLLVTVGPDLPGDRDAVLAAAREMAGVLGVSLEVRDGVPGSSLSDVVRDVGPTIDAVGVIDPPSGWSGPGPGDPPMVVLDRSGLPAGPGVITVRADPGWAGAIAGEDLADLGARHLLCVIDETGAPVLEARCAGARAALPAGVSLEVLYALDPAGDPTGVPGAIAGRIASEPSIDAVLLARPSTGGDASSALDGAADGRSRLLAVISGTVGDGTPPGGVRVDPLPGRQGEVLVVSLVLAARGVAVAAGRATADIEIRPQLHTTPSGP